MFWFFVFFIVSGFCSLVYQVTWLRVAMANFGVTTPSISIVLSVFMAGLALGSWAGGRLASRQRSGTARSYLRFYAATEVIIGLSGFVAAPLLGVGHRLLLASAENSWGSTTYYFVSGVLITFALLPFCTCMGATFPLAMAAVRRAFPASSEKSFSFLYIANVLGAMAGCLCSALVMIELLGFRGTMLVAALLNLLVAVGALCFASRFAPDAEKVSEQISPTADVSTMRPNWQLLLLLFMTGLVSLGMEVVWTRQFVPFLGPVVYTFAIILAVYLAATLLGSRIYRSFFQDHFLVTTSTGWQMMALMSGAAALLPLIAADYRLPLPAGIAGGIIRVILGIGPFCALLGFLTPGLLDRVAAGDPRKAGFAYALNTIGCIFGPLLAGFLLLPLGGERWSLLLLALPLFILGALFRESKAARPVSGALLSGGFAFLIVLSLGIIVFTRDYEKKYRERVVLRDHTATVIAAAEGGRKQLLVNGYGMTVLTPVTKMMTHLPLTLLGRPPEKGLVLCLGMGTSYRSMLSWGISATVVELVPSIPALLPFYHADGEQLLGSPNGHIVVDDARRFLGRSNEKFDVIIVDPPPPVSAAATSLLYSVEFYRAVSKRLAPDGIFQQWIPLGEAGTDDPLVKASMAKAIAASFPYVRVFGSFYGLGLHIIASNQPFAVKSPAALSALLQGKAAADLTEWGPYPTPEEQFGDVIRRQASIQDVIAFAPDAPTMTDDRPVNEYYLLRQLSGR